MQAEETKKKRLQEAILAKQTKQVQCLAQKEQASYSTVRKASYNTVKTQKSDCRQMSEVELTNNINVSTVLLNQQKLYEKILENQNINHNSTIELHKVHSRYLADNSKTLLEQRDKVDAAHILHLTIVQRKEEAELLFRSDSNRLDHQLKLETIKLESERLALREQEMERKKEEKRETRKSEQELKLQKQEQDRIDAINTRREELQHIKTLAYYQSMPSKTTPCNVIYERSA